MLNVVIFGAPGSGKGTQSEKIVEKYGFAHFSTGDILRAEIEKKSEIGKQVEDIMAQGHFVPDELIIKMLDNAITENADAKGYIFDGFPRTVVQAQALDEMLAKRNMQVDIMLNIDVVVDELVERLVNRGKISGRTDDNIETITERIKVYEEKTMPNIDFYKAQGKESYIPGSGRLDDVFAHIQKAIDAKL